MKHLILGAAMGFFASAAAADPAGLWATEKNDDGAYLKVEITACEGDAGKLCGYIRDAITGDGASNPDYEHLGKPMVTGMVPDGVNKWDDGEIWDPSEDERYSSNMELKGDILTVEGCVLIICRGQDWTRTN